MDFTFDPIHGIMIAAGVAGVSLTYLAVFLLNKKREIMYDKIRDVDYKVISVPESIEDISTLAEVQILKGKFEGIIYTYGTISSVQENDDGTANLAFEFNITDSNGFDSDELEKDEEFANEIGEILVSIISQASENQNKLEKMIAENGVVDSE